MQSLNILFIDKIRNNTFFYYGAQFYYRMNAYTHIHSFYKRYMFVCSDVLVIKLSTLSIKKITTLGLRGNLVRPTSGQPHKNHQLDFCVVSMKFLFGIFPLLKVHVFHISRKRGRQRDGTANALSIAMKINAFNFI